MPEPCHEENAEEGLGPQGAGGAHERHAFRIALLGGPADAPAERQTQHENRHGNGGDRRDQHRENELQKRARRNAGRAPVGAPQIPPYQHVGECRAFGREAQHEHEEEHEDAEMEIEWGPRIDPSPMNASQAGAPRYMAMARATWQRLTGSRPGSRRKITRELEGSSGALIISVTSTDPSYNGLPVDGIDLHVASEHEGAVVITESNGFTAVREGGPVAADSYLVSLASQPTGTVYVTVSAARSPQEEEQDQLNNPPGLANGKGDSIWVSTSASLTTPLATEFQHTVTINGVATTVNDRSVVLVFTAANYQIGQAVYVYAPDDARSEGDRVVVMQHTVISTDNTFDGVDVRNVEVAVRDNDTPGVYVTQVAAGTSVEDARTLVIEGDTVTRLNDETLVQLAKEPAPGQTVVVKLSLDALSRPDILLLNLANDLRFDTANRTITFNNSDWSIPVRIGIQARDDFRREDPASVAVSFERDAASTDTAYVFPNWRSGTGVLHVEVIDNETAGVVVQETNANTQLVLGGATDGYNLRLTLQPAADVNVAIVTDGQADVGTIGGVAVTLRAPCGLQCLGAVHWRHGIQNVASKGTLTRGIGPDLGSFTLGALNPANSCELRERELGFDGDYNVLAVTPPGTLTLTTAFVGGAVPRPAAWF